MSEKIMINMIKELILSIDEIAEAAIVKCPSELMCEAITKASDMACVIQTFAGITKEQLHDRTL